MARERRPVNQLKKSFRKLTNDPKIPSHIRLISALCLGKIDNLIDTEFLSVIYTKRVGNPAGNSKKVIEEPEVIEAPEIDLDAILTRTKEAKNEQS
jgi:hypothetical protein